MSWQGFRDRVVVAERQEEPDGARFRGVLRPRHDQGAPHLRRHAEDGRRPDGGMVHRRRLRRLRAGGHPHAGRLRGLRPPRRARAAAPRPLPARTTRARRCARTSGIPRPSAADCRKAAGCRPNQADKPLSQSMIAGRAIVPAVEPPHAVRTARPAQRARRLRHRRHDRDDARRRRRTSGSPRTASARCRSTRRWCCGASPRPPAASRRSGNAATSRSTCSPPTRTPSRPVSRRKGIDKFAGLAARARPRRHPPARRLHRALRMPHGLPVRRRRPRDLRRRGREPRRIPSARRSSSTAAATAWSSRRRRRSPPPTSGREQPLPRRPDLPPVAGVLSDPPRRAGGAAAPRLDRPRYAALVALGREDGQTVAEINAMSIYRGRM